jgi:hypothetical protein
MHKGVFYITAAGDSRGDAALVRRCTAVSVYRHAPTRSVALSVEVDPPFLVEVCGQEELISTVHLCAHFAGDTVDPVSAWPLSVRVMRQQKECEQATHSYEGFVVVARAIMFDNVRDAIVEFNRWM